MAQDAPAVSVVAAGLKARCPRCGHGALFTRGLALRERCDRCGLDYAFIDSGDGPAVFAIFILGAVVLGGALFAEFKLHVPCGCTSSCGGSSRRCWRSSCLRVLKATLIALQFKHKAEQGRFASD